MGRSPDRTVIVEVGNIRPFSDIGGRHVIRINNSSERRQELAQRLLRAGCDVDLAGTDWHREGNFDIEEVNSSATYPERQQTPIGRGEAQPDVSPGGGSSPLVLILMPDGTPLILESSRIEAGETINMSFHPADGRDAVALDQLHREVKGKSLPLAYGSKALYARVASCKHIVEGGREVWNLEWQPDDPDYGESRAFSEVNLSGHSADDVAEMRARRILLDEKLTGAGSPYRGLHNHNAMMLESSIADTNSSTPVLRSPFPMLYKAIRDDTEKFLNAARLFAVLELLLTNTVERIQQLELRMQGEAELTVKFEGQRRQTYSNRPAHVIKVEGACDLDVD